MVWGRLARSIAWVMFWKRMDGIVIIETLFTLPKPLTHLFYQPVNTALERGIKRRETNLQRFNVSTQKFPVLGSDGHDQIMIEFCSTMICSISLNHRVPQSRS